jgi:hypothetical protein
MKKVNIAMVLVTTILFSASAFAGGSNVHHVVLLNLNEEVTAEQVEDFITVGEALISKIPGVLEVTINKKAQDDRPVHIKDYDVGLYVKWENLETGKVYGPHCLHQAFLKLYKPMVTGMKIMDFYGN